MDLFAGCNHTIKDFLAGKASEGKVSGHLHGAPVPWPVERNRNLVLAADTAVELGNPKDASTSFLFWVEDPSAVVNRRITMVGPDLRELAGRQVSFGRAVIVHGSGFDEENSYDRYREMELLRYDIHLDGYMMRGASQYRREWSRVSRKAIDRGFSFRILGGALIDKFLQLDYVRAVETIFVTSGKEDVLALQSIAGGIFDRIGAMSKMAGDPGFDCDTCEYTDVCGEISQLRAMHNAMKEKRNAANA